MMLSSFILCALCTLVSAQMYDNINGNFAVYKNRHYSNKTTVTWGQNSQKDWYVTAILPRAAAIYDCTNTTTYSCEDPVYMYDWNKLWGKARCGYTHDHHEDSDRFVFRKCSDASCAGYIPKEERIEIGAYSYDGGVAPYTGENPNLMKTFTTTILPNIPYQYRMIMEETGLSTFILNDADGNELERQTVQHKVTCTSNYFEGTVDGLYFGGTCAAPTELVVLYES